MPKLNTTVDNLELKSNKISSTSEIAPKDWTDAHYPSAKTLLNIAHPIGSVLTTSTNINPADTLGGTWELIDKAFKNTYLKLDSTYWTSANSESVLTTEQGDEGACMVSLVDHTIHIRLKLKSSEQLTDADVNLGKLTLSRVGVNSLLYTAFSQVALCDGGDCTLSYSMNNSGELIVHDVLNVNGTHTMAANKFFYVDVTQTVTIDKMLDNFCDKFYWKRTA